MKSCGNCVHSRIRPDQKGMTSIGQQSGEQKLNCTLFPPVPMLVAHERKGIQTAFGFPVVLAAMICGQWLPNERTDAEGEPIKAEPQPGSFAITN